MAVSDTSSSGPVQYRMTLPVVLAFVVCMMSVYLLAQHVYRFGSWAYAQPEPLFSETEQVETSSEPVAAAISSSQAE